MTRANCRYGCVIQSTKKGDPGLFNTYYPSVTLRISVVLFSCVIFVVSLFIFLKIKSLFLITPYYLIILVILMMLILVGLWIICALMAANVLMMRLKLSDTVLEYQTYWYIAIVERSNISASTELKSGFNTIQYVNLKHPVEVTVTIPLLSFISKEIDKIPISVFNIPIEKVIQAS